MSEQSDISEVIENCTDRIVAALDRVSQRLDQAAHELANHQDNIRLDRGIMSIDRQTLDRLEAVLKHQGIADADRNTTTLQLLRSREMYSASSHALGCHVVFSIIAPST
jgi:hypothetical protein